MSVTCGIRTMGRSPLHYGARVVIRDGSRLDGAEGIVFRVKEGVAQVLLDREVFWLVDERDLEPVK